MKALHVASNVWRKVFKTAGKEESVLQGNLTRVKLFVC